MPDGSVWFIGNLICVCVMWKGRPYVNANVSVSSIFKNRQLRRSVSQKFPSQEIQGLGTSSGRQLKNILQNALLLYCFRSYFISVVIFSILVHQMRVLDTKKLVLHIILVLEKRPKNIAAWGPQDFNLIIIHKLGF